ncbi:MAG: hypothetical protein KDC52_06180 [Ignavibacteriae bacterium]|nr:hypothetical protein [Ignavibacteriota bacterium]MCB0751043.1 hypothetical protein [Ignavibacteriota bacterium]MCB9248425.1 hypothetical protein [Ignavibacteriales bacterium]
MQFVIIAHDYKDEKALQRRLSVREQHLKFADEMFKKGTWLFASALLDENGTMNGSIIFVDYENEQELRNQWLEKEVYVTGKVWEKVEIRKVKVAKH